MKNRRRTFLVNPSIQLKLVSKFVGVIALLSIAFGTVAYLAVGKESEMMFVDPGAQEAYRTQMRLMVISLAATIILGCSAVWVLGILITHKIVGPLVPIQRFVEELAKGNYEVRDIKLRKGDELQELAARLNELKIHIKEKQDDQRKTAG